MRPIFSVIMIVLACTGFLSSAALDKPVIKGFQLGMDLTAALANAKQLSATGGLNFATLHMAPVAGGPMREVSIQNIPTSNTFAFQTGTSGQKPIGIVYFGEGGFVLQGDSNGKLIKFVILPPTVTRLFPTLGGSTDDLLTFIKTSCHIPQFPFVESRPPFAHWIYTDKAAGWAIAVFKDRHIEVIDVAAVESLDPGNVPATK
jgi:hypothetical protein